jgi:hypothetical protein
MLESQDSPVDDKQPVYITIKELKASDIVDEPAANASGLFSTKFNADKFAVRVTSFLDENPDVWKFIDEHPEKFTPFLEKYHAYKSKNTSAMTHKNKGKSFFQKLASAFVHEETSFATVDAKTTDNKNIRIETEGDKPAVGDALYIVDPETDEVTVAPDGDYTVSEGDYDQFKYTVVSGKISAVFDPNDAGLEIQQASIKSYKKLQAENLKLQSEVKELQKNFQDFKKTALDKHTVVPADEENENDNSLSDQKKAAPFANQPWNKKKIKKAS